MDIYARRIAWTSAVIHGLVHASVLLLPPILGDLRRDFQVPMMDVLAAANAMYFVFGMAAIPAGFLADRFGSRRMMTAATMGCAMALLLLSQAPNFTVFAGGLVLLGLAAGVYHPSGLSLLSRGVASPERGRAIGIHGVGGTFGEALAPAWAALFAAQLGWRWGFLAAAALAFGCAGLTLTLPKTAMARDHHHAPRATFGQSMRLFARTLANFWASRPLRWLLVSTIAGGLVYRGVLTFLPLHFSDSAGGTSNASYLTSAMLIAGMAAQRFGGELADRLPRERLFLAEVALFVPVLVLLGLTSGLGLVVLALTFGFLWYMAQPLSQALTAAYADTHDHGLLYGIQFAATFGIGSFATSLGGLLMDRGGTSFAFVGFGVVALLQLGAVAFLVRSTTQFSARSPAVPG